jgi:hypothetical protein
LPTGRRGNKVREYSAEEILEGVVVRKPSPTVKVDYSDDGFAWDRVSRVPEPGIHPRILFGPDDIEGIRTRLETTGTGRVLLDNLRDRTCRSLRTAGTWEYEIMERLIDRDLQGADRLLNDPKPVVTGHYQPNFTYPLMLEAFDCLIYHDVEHGQRVASALSSLAESLEPKIDAINAGPYSDNEWRSGVTAAMHQHLVGYCYDFAYGFMSDDQRDVVRRLIAKATGGKITHGMELPSHWRNWNWVNCAQQFLLLTLAIEGEEGYDPRIYDRSVEVMRDFFTYGVSPAGSARESVGYTAFGFVWATPALIAMARRGDNIFLHSHYRSMKHWYLHSLQPFGYRWLSHGDGGDGGPGVHFIQAMKYYYPNDPIVDYVWQNTVLEAGKEQLKGRIHLVPTIICAEDGLKDANGELVDYRAGAVLGQSNTFFDPERGSLITRDEWSKDAVVLQFECRHDSVGPSHEHADRGSFTLSALGRAWALDGFRSVETRYHNCVLIDGKGQGYFTPPGQWLGLYDSGNATFGVCDSKNAYDWFWPKTMVATTELSDPRLSVKRWSGFKDEIVRYKGIYGGMASETDPTPSVVEYYEGYLDGDPRMWDEDTWPVRLPFNPVKRAYRTAGLVRGKHTYALIIDDIQKDDEERLYEWTMMTCMDLDVVRMSKNDIILGERRQPQVGDPQLLVRVLYLADPADPADYSARPSARLEVFEKKDMLMPGGRSFGLDKRVIIGSRSCAPDFKILLLPHRHGEVLPETTWSEDGSRLLIRFHDQEDEYSFSLGEDGRTRVAMVRNGDTLVQVD